MARQTRDILIGLTTLAALALVLAYLYGGRSVAAEAGQMQLSATFNRVDGLFEGDPVYLAGIPVGRVEAMHLNDNYRAVVRFSVRDSLNLPTDSSASIQTDGLFGSKFVVLEPGGALDNLESGGRISYTQDALVVSDLLDLIISEGQAARQGDDKSADGESGDDASGAGDDGNPAADLVPSLGGN